MTAHTPGPWQTGGMMILTDRPSTVTPDGRTIHHWKDIAEVRHFNGPLWDSPEGNANANLIAAAPELLAALKSLVDAQICRDGGKDCAVCAAAFAAIAKAENVAP